MHARVTQFDGSPDQVDAAIKMLQEQTIPTAKQAPGFKGGYWCLDRETGEGVAITLWESLQALRASEEMANKLREEAREKVGAPQMQVAVYEVIGQA